MRISRSKAPDDHIAIILVIIFMRDTGSCIRIRNFQYASFQSTRPRLHSDRNPIRIVIDKIGADGTLHQQIVNQNDDL